MIQQEFRDKIIREAKESLELKKRELEVKQFFKLIFIRYLFK